MTAVDILDSKAPIIIPARSGSVGLKNKNILPLGGKPLLAWAIEAAKRSELADRIIVDTDSLAYQVIAKAHGAETPYLRPPELAEDVPTEDVLIHAVEELRKESYDPAVVVCVQCTTPFVEARDIDACIYEVLTSNAESAITVCEVSERPEWAFTMNGDYLQTWLGPEYGATNADLKGAWGIRQSHPKLFRPNGGCYAVKTDILFATRQVISPRCKAVVMSRARSVDIDDQFDLEFAQFMASRDRS